MKVNKKMSDEYIKIAEEKRILDAITVQSNVIVPIIPYSSIIPRIIKTIIK